MRPGWGSSLAVGRRTYGTKKFQRGMVRLCLATSRKRALRINVRSVALKGAWDCHRRTVLLPVGRRELVPGGAHAIAAPRGRDKVLCGGEMYVT